MLYLIEQVMQVNYSCVSNSQKLYQVLDNLVLPTSIQYCRTKMEINNICTLLGITHSLMFQMDMNSNSLFHELNPFPQSEYRPITDSEKLAFMNQIPC